MPEWPSDENGEPIPPVFLMHTDGGDMNMELTQNLLSAYGIPLVGRYPNDGLFGKLIMGQAPYGAEIFVPETMLEDAQNMLNADFDID